MGPFPPFPVPIDGLEAMDDGRTSFPVSPRPTVITEKNPRFQELNHAIDGSQKVEMIQGLTLLTRRHQLRLFLYAEVHVEIGRTDIVG